MDELASSHAIIKALKGTEDPPSPGGLSKIEIAWKVWKSTSIHFPNKDEALAEWILNSFIKQSKDVRGSNGKALVLSKSYWSLLSEILSTSLPPQHARHNRVWLLSLLNRISVLNIVTIFFKYASDADFERKEGLVDPFMRSIHVLWPLASSRMNLDALTDCLGAILEYVSSDATQLTELASVCLLAVRSFRQVVGNSSGRKKAFSWFIQQSFLHWAHLVCIETSTSVTLERDAKIFRSEVYQAGLDIFFCLDSLKASSNPLESILTDPKFSLSNLQNTQLQIVPMLYKSYVQEIRKHQRAVFGSSSNQTEERNNVRDAGLRTFTTCYKAIREYGDVLEVWQNLLLLLEALEEANLVGYGLSEKTDVLNEIAASAVQIVAEPKDDRVERSGVVLRILCVLARIDFDIINPFLLEIFSGLLALNPSVYPSTQSLLREILDFHSKTRTMSSYLAILLECLSDGRVAARYSDMRIAHRECTAGALLSLSHVELLSPCIKSFLTPGQTPETTHSSLTALQKAWAACSGEGLTGGTNGNAMEIETTGSLQEVADANRNRSQTRRKFESFGAIAHLAEREALAYSLVARAVAVIVPSLPFSSLSENAYASVRGSITSAWTEMLVKATQAAFNDLVSPSECWSAQCVSAATLRIRHALLMCHSLSSLDLLSSPIMMPEKATVIIRSTESIPELIVELFRAFFDVEYLSATPDERFAIIDALLTYLTTHLDLSDAATKASCHARMTWDASISSLDLLQSGGHMRGALAVWHLLLDRWLPILDEIATQEHLSSLSRICLLQVDSCNNVCLQSRRISFTWVMDRALRSAAFWELPNLRDAMVSELDSATQGAVWEDFTKLLRQAQKSSNPRKPKKGSALIWKTQQAQTVLRSFSMLLRAPREYFPRSLRSTFVRRALVADLAVSVCERDTDLGRKAAAVIRAWLVLMSDSFDMVDLINDGLGAYTEYLMDSEDCQNYAGVDVNVMTLELLSCAFRQIIHSALQGKEDQFKIICASLQQLSSNLSERSLMKFIEILTVECTNAEKLTQASVQAIRDLYSNIHARYSTSLSSALPSLANITKEQTHAIHSWRTCLALRKWLNIPETTSSFGAPLIRRLAMLSCDSFSGQTEASYLCAEAFILLLEELHIVAAEEREQHLTLTASAYVLFHGKSHLLDHAACNTALGRTLRSISVNEFAFVLSLLREALAKGLASSDESQAVVHLSSILLGDAPEGAMKITQEHFEECLHIFCSGSKFTTGHVDLTIEVLSFIGKVCSEKPASLRHLALGSIWLLLVKILTGSTTHTSESHVRILHAISSISGSLIRLRRDLVTSTLPHLGAVLRSLILTLRAPRAQLGARQRAQVSDTLPWWITPSVPLGIPEARAVARLLTTLQAKTIPRTFTSRDRAHGKEKGRSAEALLGAFSKHAGPVLGAYLGVLADPLVVLDAGRREALAPGLYALCEAMGEHGRDALMVSGCDAAGKTVFKALWRDYEKQRYVGKG